MTLNPIAYTESVVGDFLRYQLTAYRFADARLHAQMRQLLSLDETRHTPLFKGPYVSLSRAFRTGAPVRELIAQGTLHPFMESLIPYAELWGHQTKAIRAIGAGRTTLVSTGTGSGKTECFLYPVMGRCLELRDAGKPAGIRAIFVYPTNALAEDQLARLRGLLAGTGVPFGMYVGKTKERAADVAGQVLAAGSSRADYRAALDRAVREGRGLAVHPPEERVSREQMRAPGQQPRILLTNVKQLELLLTRQRDIELFDNARLEFLVFDEAHTYGGAAGGEAACLIRRLMQFRGSGDTVCIGTSATLVGSDGGADPAREFAARFFGVPGDTVELVQEEYQADDWSAQRTAPPAPALEDLELLRRTLRAVHGDGDGMLVADILELLTGSRIPAEGWPEHLYGALAANELCHAIAAQLGVPRPLEQLAAELAAKVGRAVGEGEVLSYLVLGAASRRDGRPLLRPVVHGFLRGVGGAVVTFPPDQGGPRLWLSADQIETPEGESVAKLPILTCNTCGQHYFEHSLADFRFGPAGLEGGEAVADRRVWRSQEAGQGGARVLLLDRLVGAEEDDDDPARSRAVFFCRSCGAVHPADIPGCDACGRTSPLVRLLAGSRKRTGRIA